MTTKERELIEKLKEYIRLHKEYSRDILVPLTLRDNEQLVNRCEVNRCKLDSLESGIASLEQQIAEEDAKEANRSEYNTKQFTGK